MERVNRMSISTLYGSFIIIFLFQVMVLFLLIMRMELGIVIGEMQGGGVEEEDVASEDMEGEDTMVTGLICSKMVDTTRMHLFKAVVFASFSLFLFIMCVRMLVHM